MAKPPPAATPRISRRRMIGAVAAAGAAAISTEALFAQTATPPAPDEIAQPASPNSRALMQRAFDMRRAAVASGDQAFGAIIVRGDRIVGLGPSRVVINGDPSAHAEIEAIRDACRRLGTRDLSDCVMYSTSRPCRMCETAAYWARLSRMFYGASITDGGAPTYDGC